MPGRMFASDKPISLEEIQALVPSDLESTIDSKLGGMMVILSIRKDRTLVMDFNVLDEEGSADTCKDFQSVGEPIEFAEDLASGKLHFVLCNCHEDFGDEVDAMVTECQKAGVLKYDATTKSVARLG